MDGMSLEAASDLWWKNAVVYCVDTASFLDSNGDGVGDLDGLTQRIDYLAGLGVTCLWLMPIYPSPERDYGYDVADFYGSPRSSGRWAIWLSWCALRGTRDPRDRRPRGQPHVDRPCLVPAGKEGASDLPRLLRLSCDEKPPNADEGVIFPGKQESIWSYDRAARRWYMHRFYPHQPDLNVNNPLVRNEIIRSSASGGSSACPGSGWMPFRS